MATRKPGIKLNMKHCKRTIMYSYINSGNHGCEAIARSTYDILEMSENTNYIFSSDIGLDQKMHLNTKWNLISISNIHGLFPIASLFPRILRRIKIDADAVWKYVYRTPQELFDKDTLALSTGGDVYCYDGSDWLSYLNRVALSKGAKTVLWGCSIEENRLDNRVIEDLKAYNLIVVRETYTLAYLREKGIFHNVKYAPDPAFILKKEPVQLSEWDFSEKTIGINLSSHIIKCQKTYQVFCDFIKYILEHTEYHVLLIPHVFWAHENDLALLTRIYKEISHSRLHLVNREYNCMQLKHIISRCKIYIGARTHSVIAAYSTFVPALALSYSVKSRGIAYDLFGTEENYVLPVTDQLTIPDLLDKLAFFTDHADLIIQTLHQQIPRYERLIYSLKADVEKLFEN